MGRATTVAASQWGMASSRCSAEGYLGGSTTDRADFGTFSYFINLGVADLTRPPAFRRISLSETPIRTSCRNLEVGRRDGPLICLLAQRAAFDV
jgi:hypothetical protein